MLETAAYVLNPGRKVRRRKGRARRRSNARGWFATRGRYRGGVRRRFRGGIRYTRPKKSTVLARRGRRRRNNPNPRRYRRYRRNPGIGGMSLAFPADVLPVRLPLPGVIGDVANGVLQGVAAGAVVMGGYLVSGALVNALISPARAEREGGFIGKWARPILFAATAGLIGSLVAMIAPKGRKTTFGLLAAAGPGVRALGGVVKAVMEPPKEAGFMQDVYNLSVGLADYLQVGDTDEEIADIYEAGMGEEEEEGVSDYLQVDEGVSDIYEAGLGAEEEVVGI